MAFVENEILPKFTFQIALYISTLLLGISALGHGFAFCVNKVQKNRRKTQFREV